MLLPTRRVVDDHLGLRISGWAVEHTLFVTRLTDPAPSRESANCSISNMACASSPVPCMDTRGPSSILHASLCSSALSPLDSWLASVLTCRPLAAVPTCDVTVPETIDSGSADEIPIFKGARVTANSDALSVCSRKAFGTASSLALTGRRPEERGRQEVGSESRETRLRLLTSPPSLGHVAWRKRGPRSLQSPGSSADHLILSLSRTAAVRPATP